jgi:hypothetical protein
MKKLKLCDLYDKTKTDELFEKSVYIDLSDKDKPKKKGVETLIFSSENGATIILEKNCETEEILGVEIFE